MKIQRPVAGQMRAAAAVILMCLAVFSSACALTRQAKKRSGANVVVQQTGGARIKGELVGVRSEGLVLDTKKGAVSIPISDIKSLWMVEKMSNEGRTAWAVGGLAGGIALGVGAAKASHVQPNDWGDSIALGGAFLLGGMIVGEGIAVLIATRTKKGTVYDFENKSPEEIELILTDLRKLARVPDYR